MGMYTVHDIHFSIIWSKAIDIFHEAMRVAMPCITVIFVLHNIGGIRMLRNEEKQWELQVDHSLFAIEKLDITVSIIYAEFSIITEALCVHGGSTCWN